MPEFTFTSSPGQVPLPEGTHRVRVRANNAAGSSAFSEWSEPFTVTAAASAPVITRHSLNQTVAPGSTITLFVEATAATSFNWQNDAFGVWAGDNPGVTVSAATGTGTGNRNEYTIGPINNDGIRYRCTVTNATGSVETFPILVTLASTNPWVGTLYRGGPNGYKPAKTAADRYRANGDTYGASMLDKIASEPYPNWIQVTKENNVKVSPRNFANARRTEIGSLVGALLIYAIPWRDLGSFSAGGWADEAEYKWAIDEILVGLGNRRTIIGLEPDAMADIPRITDAFRRTERVNSLRYAVSTITAHAANHVLYIDSGNPSYIGNGNVSLNVDLLQEILQGNTRIRGFMLNVSNFHDSYNGFSGGGRTYQSAVAYGNAVSDEYHRRTGKRLYYVIDSGRNGRGLHPDLHVINPKGRALGEKCRAATEGSLPFCDAFYWFKPPGESDGSNGETTPYDGSAAPGAGSFWPGYAIDLAIRAAY